MKRLLFLVSAAALASALPACWRAFSMSSAGEWSEVGDGLLFWLTWATDHGWLRMLGAAELAFVIILVTTRVNPNISLWRLGLAVMGFFSKPMTAGACVVLALLPHLMVQLKRPDTTGKPDVLFILIDTLRLDHVGWGGSELDTTPKLDALAHKGAAFSQAITQAPWTKPSVATLMTSQVPGIHGAVDRGLGIAESNRTMAEAFSVDGYRTACFSSNPNISPLFGFHQGFQEYTLESYGEAPSFIERSNSWLDAGGDQASFLYLHFNDVHFPYDPPPEFEGMFNHTGLEVRLDGSTERAFRENLGVGFTVEEVESLRLSYAEEIRCLDGQLGEFVEGLLERNDNLLVVICSDHGEEFLEHGDIGHGQSLYEELIRVPLQFAWSPALGARLGLKPGFHNEQVRNLDVLPTLLELAGIAWPQEGRPLNGASLGPFLRDEDPGEPRLAFSETDHPGSPLSGPTGPMRSLRTPDSKLVVTDPWFEPSAGRAWLFQLTTDPGERHNVVLMEPSLAQSLWIRLQDAGWMVERSYQNESVEITATEAAVLSEMGYGDDGPASDGFGGEPYLNPKAVPWAEITLGED